jgi:spoIIIJ-associated protein
MLEVVKVEGKTKEEALNKALAQLNSNESEVYYFFEEEVAGLFKPKKEIANVITKYELKEFIKKYISTLARKMNTIIESEIIINDNIINVTLVSDKNAALIGKEGKTLNSIQTILRQTLRNLGNFDIKINLDIAGYKQKREKNIVYEAKQIAKEVVESGIDASLEPMNSYERRIVHNALAEYKNVITESEGETPNRRVVIKFKEDAK